VTPGLDPHRLREHLDRELPGVVTGELRAELLAGGRSNLTYAVTDGATRWVVRRPPLGHVLPTAHDMAREHRVMSALCVTAVPVPRPVLYCADTEVLGAPFYVMEQVDGVAPRGAADLVPLGTERTRTIGLSLVDTLVELHAVGPAAVGLADFGRPEGFLDRQLRRWHRQLDASRSREVAALDTLGARLRDTVPRSPDPVILHGDYRLDNVLVDGEDRVRAVLDWEMATLGDPLTDLALLIVYNGFDKPGPDGLEHGADSAPGYPGAAEIVSRYADRSGRDVSALDWYLGFACFKIAVIAEGIHYRFTLGQTVGTGFDRMAHVPFELAEQGNAALDR
jgi:aminoglycoside phosphotransferase (APT) family kinase protein